jgi:hypothetical protein
MARKISGRVKETKKRHRQRERERKSRHARKTYTKSFFETNKQTKGEKKTVSNFHAIKRHQAFKKAKLKNRDSYYTLRIGRTMRNKITITMRIKYSGALVV